MPVESLSEQQIAYLVGGGECPLHTHPEELLGFSERLELMNATPVRTITGDVTANARDEILLADTTNNTITITLPLANKGREFQTTKISPNHLLYVVPTAPDTLIGSTMGVIIRAEFTSLHWKAVDGGYILI